MEEILPTINSILKDSEMDNNPKALLIKSLEATVKYNKIFIFIYCNTLESL
jgi:hypothetical protein